MSDKNRCHGGESSPTQASSSWTRSEDKIFERGLVVFPESTPDRWLKIAVDLPGKTPAEVLEHYEALVADVEGIESGRVTIPPYSDESPPSWDDSSASQHGSPKGKRRGDVDRKKGLPWTEDEHRLFLIGLERYGKGDWRSISRNVVVTRTPTQVASHAQKYYLRQNDGGKKERKRSSIHDITTVDSDTTPHSSAALPRPSAHFSDQGGGGPVWY